MKRRILAFVTALFFIFSTSALAYQNNSYYSGLKIGLENMLSSSIYITLNGNYKVNGNSFSKGTSSYIIIKDGKLDFKGVNAQEITFIPESKSSTIRLAVGAKQYNYLGNMTFKISNSKILPINMINVEDYLKGVVGYEMSNSYPVEALKAQAVAARNYALYNVGKHKSKGYDLCDTTDCQVYRGYNSNYGNVIRAVDETKGIVLLYDEKLVGGYFAASNGGYTESSENVWVSALPYLRAYKDEFDNQGWPYGDRVLSASSIESTLKSKGYLASTDKFIRIDLSTIKRYTSGRVSNIEIVYKTSTGTEKRRAFSKEGARTFLSLPSSMYSIMYDEKTNTYTFSGKGFGHGLGMSQIGARNRANAKQMYDEILAFYYKNSYIKELLSKIKEFGAKDRVLVGDKLLLDSKGQSGSENGYLFKYEIEKDKKLATSRDYSEESKFEFTPSASGEYIARLYLKDKLSGEEYDDSRTIKFTAIDSPRITGITTSPSEPMEKKAVSLRVSSAGGTEVSYKFEVLKDGKTVSSQNFSSGTNLEFTPQSSGKYIAKVYIKDKISSRDYDDYKEISIDVKKESSNSGNSQSITIGIPLKKGMKGNDVEKLQRALAALGYSIGSIDGVFGGQTYNAVVSFQRSKELGADGVVGRATLDAINKALGGSSKPPVNPEPNPVPPVDNRKPALNLSRTLKRGLKGDDVRTLQEILKGLGFYVGSLDGAFGTGTYNSVRNFQSKNGLKADGVVGSQTANILNSKIGSSSNNPSSGESNTQKPPTTNTSMSFKISRVLKRGMKGEDVKKLQEALRYLNFAAGNPDGSFGAQTETAVKSFQRLNGLMGDGVVGLGTAKKLDEVLKR